MPAAADPSYRHVPRRLAEQYRAPHPLAGRVPRGCGHPNRWIARWRADAPDAELLVHPECGCSSQALAFAAEGALILSTERMVEHVRTSPAKKFLVATEVGILHRLRLEAPTKEFEPLRRDAVCRFMKLTTLQSVRDALALDRHVISVPDDVAARARTAIRRMVEIG